MQPTKVCRLPLLTGLALLAMPFAGMAAITFNDANVAGNIFQQTQNSPCVIGNNSCNEPSGFTDTTQGPPGDYDIFSPQYLATSPFLTYSGNKIPTGFKIGIDENLATSHGPEVLQAFNTYDCGTTGAACSIDSNNSFTGPHNIPDNNNGNGFSDMTLSGFSLTAGHFYKFEANVTNDTDGGEQFFIIPAGTPAVPEPSSVFVLTTLLALGLLARRRMKAVTRS